MNGFVAAKLEPPAQKTTDTHRTKIIEILADNTFTINNLLGFYGMPGGIIA
jgi:hypothetical protein